MKKVRFIPIMMFFLCSCAKDSKWADDTATLFTKVPSNHSGVTFSNDLIETEDNNHLLNDEFITGAGVAVGDINNDGLTDIFFTSNQGQDRLYLNQGNLQFKDISQSAGILDDKRWSTGVTFVDINSDGYQDIYICKNVLLDHESSKNQLYLNNGDLSFTEKADDYRIADKGFSIQASFFDFDKDGMLDFYLVNQPPSLGNRNDGTIEASQHMNLATTDKLYKRLESNLFRDAGPYAETRNFAYGLSATVGDLNNDTWPDIYVANDFDQPDHIYLNLRDGRYRDVVNSSVKHISNFSMGTDIADYDNDGLLDVFVLDMVAEDHKRIKVNMGGMNPETFWATVDKGRHYQYMFNTLQRNNGNATFSELAHLAGVSNTDWSWGALFSDFDNDGYKDLFVTNGVRRNMRHSDLTKEQSDILDSLEIVAARESKPLKDYIDLMKFVEMAPIDKLPNYIFKNNGDMTFEKKVDEWGFSEPTLSNGCAYADLDNDGDLELIVNNIDAAAGIYRNNAVERGEGNFLRVNLKVSNSASRPGTKVRLYKEGAFWQLVEITGARGYMSQSEEIAHFGLGDQETVDRVEVEWPDGELSVLKDVKANQLVVVEKGKSDLKRPIPSNSPDRLFKEVTAQVKLTYRHEENEFDDYEREVLLPHKMSEFGPTMATGDINGDGLDDLYIGGSAGISGTLYVQKRDGSFLKNESSVIAADRNSEDAGSVFFDADGDKDLDLFVVSGGNEFAPDSPELTDRLYLNNGSGQFRKSSKLPDYLGSGGTVLSSDFDKDGDLDLFIAGRMVPGSYPRPASSFLLKNDGKGSFLDVTAEVATEFKDAGMVTSASWTDIDNDGWEDLIVVGEWMPVTVFRNNGGKSLTKSKIPGLMDSEGWYYSVAAKDMDMDGDMDFVVGNLGLNYKYKASIEEPFEVYSGDFDDNGQLDIVLSYYENDVPYPVRGRSCSSQQIPDISEKFETYEAFGDADLFDIYGDELGKSLKYEAKTFASYYVENLGNATFKMHKLPVLAQTSSINNVLLQDFDGDGFNDILISGNLYQSEIETPRNDAGMGLFMKGNGTSNFSALSIKESGFFAPHDAKSMVKLKIKGKDHIVIGNNQYWLQVIEVNKDLASTVAGTN